MHSMGLEPTFLSCT